MARRCHSTPLMIEGGEATPLRRLDYGDRSFDEDRLQQLLFDHPELLPVAELEPVFEEPAPIAREVPTGSGPMDLLYANAHGYPVLVETKLWRNPEARRGAVAQVIDYAKELSRWSYGDLAEAVGKARHRVSDEEDPLLEAVRQADPELDDQLFIDRLSRNLRLGRFLLLIVGDGIREDMERLAEYFRQTPQLGFTLSLVEIGLYRVGDGDDGPLFVQPQVLARTQEVTRAVVEVRRDVDPSGVTVTFPAETTDGGPTEKEFLEQLASNAGHEVAEFAKSVLDEAKNRGLEIQWGQGGPILKFTDEATAEEFTLGQLHRIGLLTAMPRFAQKCRKLGLPDRIWQEYFDEVAALIPGAERRCFPVAKGDGSAH